MWRRSENRSNRLWGTEDRAWLNVKTWFGFWFILRVGGSRGRSRSPMEKIVDDYVIEVFGPDSIVPTWVRSKGEIL